MVWEVDPPLASNDPHPPVARATRDPLSLNVAGAAACFQPGGHGKGEGMPLPTDPCAGFMGSGRQGAV